MSIRWSAVLVLASAAQALGGVFSYECDTDPTASGWDVSQIYCAPELWVDLCDPAVSLDNWCFFEHMEMCEGDPPPGGQSAVYIRTLDDFIGEVAFFVEWRVHTDADRSELIWGGGGFLGLGNNYGIRYSVYIAGDQVEFNRDVQLPIIFVDLDPAVPHTYRLELYGDRLYVWYIDGEIVDEGVPEGSFPSFDPRITWSTKASWEANTTIWDYIRYGVIPFNGSGDYDSDRDVDADDYYFFMQYFSGEGIDAGPGGRFADFDNDADVDCADWLKFASRWRRTEADPADAAPAECRPPAESLSKAVDDRPPFSSFHRP